MKNVGFIFNAGYLKVVKLLLLLSLVVSPAAYAQNKQLESLLEEYPESKLQIDLYTKNSKTKVGPVDFSNGYKVISSEQEWSIIEFNEPTVPLWVSADFVEQKNSYAKVVTKRLNARLDANISALKVTTIYLNYQSQILNSRNGFVQIKVPSTRQFAAKNSDLKTLPSSVGVTHLEGANIVKKPTLRAQVEKTVTSAPVIQRKSKSAIETSKETSIEADSHIIAPGDAISLLVFGEPDLSVENLRVPESGRVSLPLIGSVAVGGQTTKQVEGEIREILSSGYVKNPRLSVSIFSYRPIFIRGAISSTGAFPYTEGLSIAQAIALAGGAKKSAKSNGVNILRDGIIVEEGLSLDSQRQVSSGDVITILEEIGVSDDEAVFIYLHGEVASPGEYRYRKGLTVEKAIVLAGGFTLRASRKKIKITRYIDVEDNKEPVKLKNVELYTTIQPGDIISVRASLF